MSDPKIRSISDSYDLGVIQSKYTLEEGSETYLLERIGSYPKLPLKKKRKGLEPPKPKETLL